MPQPDGRGLGKALSFRIIEAYSAGTKPKGMDPRAVKVMIEAGVDISGQRSKHVDELENIDFDMVITLCGDAKDNCPVFSGKASIMHFGFEDPPRLAEGSADEEEVLGHYRRIRDEIGQLVSNLLQILKDI